MFLCLCEFLLDNCYTIQGHRIWCLYIKSQIYCLMFNTFFSTTYMLLSVFCLVFGIGISAFGFSAGRDWNPDDFGERQYLLEKKLYLVTTFFTVGLYLKLLLIPLWFFTLGSLRPFVPGTMCIIGVHLAIGSVGFYATALKFFVPSVYLYWLILNHLDRKLESQPFMKVKIVSLIPVSIIFSAEALLDFISLSKLSPKPVSCCSSIFDVPNPKIPHIFMETSWFWVCLLVATATYILLRLMWIKNNKARIEGGIITIDIIFIFASFLSFILALHTKMSPIFLNMPGHHCIFCLWQRLWDVPIASISFFAGIWLYLIFLVISSHKAYDLEKSSLIKESIKLLDTSFMMIISGILVLTIHFVMVLLHNV